MNWLGFVSNMNATLRGFLIILVIAGIITALSLEDPLRWVFLIVRIAFLVAIAFFVYRVWRERREEIAAWPTRPRLVLYGGALLAVVNLALAFVIDYPSGGLEVLIFIAVLVGAGFSMWSVWREQHRYGY